MQASFRTLLDKAPTRGEIFNAAGARGGNYNHFGFGVIGLQEIFGHPIFFISAKQGIIKDQWYKALTVHTIGCHPRSNGNQCHVYV